MSNESNSTWRLIAASLLVCMSLLATTAHSQAITLAQPTVGQTAKINAIFHWAQEQPAVQPLMGGASAARSTGTEAGQGYIFRKYPTGNYLAATNTELYAYGPATNFALLLIGKVDDFYCSIVNCDPTPVACQPPKVWIPGVGACVAPIGTKLIDPQAPPMEGLAWPTVGGAVWRQAARDGIIQFFDTGMVLAGFATEPIVGAYFINPSGGAYCITLVYKKDGVSIYSSPYTYGRCGSTPFDWVMGTNDGYIIHDTNPVRCIEDTWKQAELRFQTAVVPCP